jgi:biopolymer transport protein ExbD
MKRFDQINVIPFIDIMLVLLAIVLMTATFIAQGKIKIDVPVATSSESLPSDNLHEIAIDQHKVYYFDEEAIHFHTLQRKIKALPRTTAIQLRVEKSVPFENFIKVVDILKNQQMEHLTIVTRKP